MHARSERLWLMSGAQDGPNQEYYQYVDGELSNFLSAELPKNSPNVLFIPALWTSDTEKRVLTADEIFGYATQHWGRFGLDLIPLHRQHNMQRAIEQADAIIVGGGSIHTLVEFLNDHNLVFPIHDRIREGGVYIGTSAGSIITCPTMDTTNEPAFKHIEERTTLSIVPFQIAAHYPRYNPKEYNYGPSRYARLVNYLLLNDESLPVLCLPDGAYIVQKGHELTLRGTAPATLITPRIEEYEFQPGTDISLLLDTQSDYYLRLNE